jgi:hypothetical protein
MPTISSWAAFISVLVDRLVDVYMHITDAKELWDALVAKYDVTDAGSKLYTTESLHDFRMVNNHSVVKQAHEKQILVKKLKLLKYPLPDKFVAGCMIAKLPSSWRNFAAARKHKRHGISVENLIASLDIWEKAWAKDASKKEGEAHSSANMVQKNNPTAGTKGRLPTNLPRLLTLRRSRLQSLKELASHGVMVDTSQGIVQTVQIARRRLAMDLDPRMSTR